MIAEAKPILVIYIKINSFRGLTYATAQQNMEKKFADYHVICVSSETIKEDVELKTFYEKDVTQTTIDQFKGYIVEEIEKLKNDTGNQRHY